MSCSLQGQINDSHRETTVRLDHGGQSHGWRGASHFLSLGQFIHTGEFSLVQNQIATELYLKLHFIQNICFPGLDEHERAHFLCALKRLNTIAEVQAHTDNRSSRIRKPFSLSLSDRLLWPHFIQASVNKVRVLVDAEYTYMNPALSLVTMAMMKKFNRDDAWIWNTYQCYLKANISVLHTLKASQGCLVLQVYHCFLSIRSPSLLYWKLCACPRTRVSVWVWSLYGGRTWIKRGW